VRLRVASLEREPATVAQRRPDRGERRAQRVVVDEARLVQHAARTAAPVQYGVRGPSRGRASSADMARSERLAASCPSTKGREAERHADQTDDTDGEQRLA
jgi:hypothetical protein